MTKRKIFFRADADAQIGYGHFTRTLALAGMLREDFDCTFFTQSPSEYQQREAKKICTLVALPSDNSRFEKFLNYLTGEEIVVLDNYFYTTEYQKRIKGKGCKLVCIDDMHDKHYVADVVVNHGLTDESLFDAESYTRLCLGFDYALLRKPFLQSSNTKKLPNSWFVAFGGTDYLNVTERVLMTIHDFPCVENITVVIGDMYKYKENLKNYPKATIKRNLPAEEMAELMRKSQYAVLPSSSVCIEALACGCKVAAGYFVDNQKPYHDEWSGKGFVWGLGNITENVPSNIINILSAKSFNVSATFTNISSKYIEIFKNL